MVEATAEDIPSAIEEVVEAAAEDIPSAIEEVAEVTAGIDVRE